MSDSLVASGVAVPIFLPVPGARTHMALPEDYGEQIREARRQKDDFFRDAPQSPIPDDERESFDGLRYYPPHPEYYYELLLHEHDEKARITVETTADGEREYLRWGEFRFEVDGRAVSLQAYRRPAAKNVGEGLWLPFRDATSGSETYGAGRYLDLDPADDRTDEGEWIVDFNRAYSPYCAYNNDYECPLVPGENWLDVPIRAGEKVDAAD